MNQRKAFLFHFLRKCIQACSTPLESLIDWLPFSYQKVCAIEHDSHSLRRYIETPQLLGQQNWSYWFTLDLSPCIFFVFAFNFTLQRLKTCNLSLIKRNVFLFWLKSLLPYLHKRTWLVYGTCLFLPLFMILLIYSSESCLRSGFHFHLYFIWNRFYSHFTFSRCD